jgi:hypothetical protein
VPLKYAGDGREECMNQRLAEVQMIIDKNNKKIMWISTK